ncbi:MAG TPA: hypothetical protein VHG92_09535 [Afifellaceae bacterium]|nr:hypothetical protein [Afifellaceae bacterium]
MIQVVGVALLAVGGLYAWSALKREMKRLEESEKRTADKPDDTLEFDPIARRYRPRDKGRDEPAG